MKKLPWEKKHVRWGVTAFCVLAASILFFQFVSNLSDFLDFLGRIFDILSPIIWGLVIAYLLYPLTKIFSRVLFTPLFRLLFRKRNRRGGKALASVRAVTGRKKALSARELRTIEEKLARGFSVFLAMLTMLILMAVLVYMVAPQLYNSVASIVINIRDYIARTDAWLNQSLQNFPAELRLMITDAFGDFSGGIVKWATENLLPEMRGLLINITANVVSVVRNVYDVIIGLIVSIYVLYSMETFAGICKKTLYVLFSVENAGRILRELRFANEVFQGFLSGKILDSILMGLLCFIGCTIMQTPYTLLVSVTVGVTNVIPYFGPFIGAIPAALIILIYDPIKMLFFLIFIFLLQQFDGNVVGPKILGDQIGIDGFWVLFSILLGAGLFGFYGMLLGVPVFVVLSDLADRLANRKLARNHLFTEAKDYRNLSHYALDGTPVMLYTESRKEGTEAAGGADGSGDNGTDRNADGGSASDGGGDVSGNP